MRKSVGTLERWDRKPGRRLKIIEKAGKVYTSGQRFSNKFVDNPLDVVRYDGELYSLRNRRHTAFSVAQATERDELMRIPC